MLKLIACDIDGTLIPYGETSLRPVLFSLVGRLREKGILFCPASGRQYHSMRRLFAPIADQIMYLCENGAIVYGPGTEEGSPVLCRTVMDRPEAEELSRTIAALEGCDVMISGANTSYLIPRHEDFPGLLEEQTGNRIAVIRDPAEIAEDILKVSAYCLEGPEEAMAALGGRWGTVFRMAVAGPKWLDFTLSDKGKGLAGLCGALGLRAEEVMAFGDNYNDVPMLEWAGTSYLMTAAAEPLRARFPRQCRRVEAVLTELLAGR